MKKTHEEKRRQLLAVIAGKRVALRNAINKLAELDCPTAIGTADYTADTFNGQARDLARDEVTRLRQLLNKEIS